MDHAVCEFASESVVIFIESASGHLNVEKLV